MSTLPRWFLKTSLEDILSVSAIELIGPIAWQKLYTNFPSLYKVLNAEHKELRGIITETQIEALKSRPLKQDVPLRLCKSKKIGLLLFGQKEYPKLLAEIDDPPLWLFYRGNIDALNRSCLSVVGSRKCSSYAKTVTEKLLTPNLLNSISTVSGLAYGIDKIAHMQSLAENQPTIAVLAGGLDTIYPVDHSQLSEKIINEGGILLSEYPPLSRPKAYRFPVRNRIVAGISKATVIIEAAIKSGSLTTAKSALDYNRDVFAVPGDITRPNAAGTNFLLQRGATPLTTPLQLLDYFDISKESRRASSIDKELQELLDLLSPEPLTIDQLTVVVNKPIEVVLGLVTQLELLDLVYQPKSGTYLRK